MKLSASREATTQQAAAFTKVTPKVFASGRRAKEYRRQRSEVGESSFAAVIRYWFSVIGRRAELGTHWRLEVSPSLTFSPALNSGVTRRASSRRGTLLGAEANSWLWRLGGNRRINDIHDPLQNCDDRRFAHVEALL